MQIDQTKADRISEQFTSSEILGFLTGAEFDVLYARLLKDGMIEEDEEETE